jgi:hypothetical protein
MSSNHADTGEVRVDELPDVIGRSRIDVEW